jgi:putative transposase
MCIAETVTINVSFQSTNLIENVLRNWREATCNVRRWNEKEDMIPRWMASWLLWAEAGFRIIRHAEALPRLAATCYLSLDQSMMNLTPASSLRF